MVASFQSGNYVNTVGWGVTWVVSGGVGVATGTTSTRGRERLYLDTTRQRPRLRQSVRRGSTDRDRLRHSAAARIYCWTQASIGGVIAVPVGE